MHCSLSEVNSISIVRCLRYIYYAIKDNFSGRQPRHDVKDFRRFGNYLHPYLQCVLRGW